MFYGFNLFSLYSGLLTGLGMVNLKVEHDRQALQLQILT